MKMKINKKIDLILSQMEIYLTFDNLQREYLKKSIESALIKIEEVEK